MTEERTVYRNPEMDEFEKRRAHLETIDGAKLKVEFDALNTAVFILSLNGKELMNFASVFSKSEMHINQLPERFSDELSRYLHNFLASAKSLMEVQRAVGNRWWSQESDFMMTERRAAMKRIFVNGEANFLYKLRDFVMHLGSQPLEIASTIHSTSGGPVIQRNTIKLSREKLLQWSGWNAEAKRFLQGQEKEFDIFAIIQNYFESVEEYHLWFWRKLERDFQCKIDEHKNKAQELYLWCDEFMGIPEWLSSGDGTPPNGWSHRRFRAGKTIERQAYGSRGYRLISVDSLGETVVGDACGWEPLPRLIDRGRYR